MTMCGYGVGRLGRVDTSNKHKLRVHLQVHLYGKAYDCSPYSIHNGERPPSVLRL